MITVGIRDLVGSMATESAIPVTRSPGGVDAHGRPAAAVPSSFYIEAVYYPATPKELLSLPEGDREGSPRLVVFTTSAIEVGDVLQVESASWQVESIAFWRDANTFKALARRTS